MAILRVLLVTVGLASSTNLRVAPNVSFATDTNVSTSVAKVTNASTFVAKVTNASTVAKVTNASTSVEKVTNASTSVAKVTNASTSVAKRTNASTVVGSSKFHGTAKMKTVVHFKRKPSQEASTSKAAPTVLHVKLAHGNNTSMPVTKQGNMTTSASAVRPAIKVAAVHKASSVTKVNATSGFTGDDKVTVGGVLVAEGANIAAILGCQMAAKGATTVQVCGCGVKVEANLLTECQKYSKYSKQVGACNCDQKGCVTETLTSGYTAEFEWQAASYKVSAC